MPDPLNPTPAELRDLKLRSSNEWTEDAVQTAKLTRGSTPKVLVAEGDSWFSFPPGLDILDQLANSHDYAISRCAEAGDTLENMVYGTEYRSGFQRREPQLEEVLRRIDRLKPAALLFSGGGNDIAGPEFAAFLNHADSGLPDFRSDIASVMIDTVFENAYRTLINRVARVNPNLHIFAHGYAEPIPDGRGVDILFFTFAGPWLLPALTRKNIPRLRGQAILRDLIGRFNAMLARLAAQHPKFHHVDLRAEIGPNDWRDELHVSNAAWARCAKKFHEAMLPHI